MANFNAAKINGDQLSAEEWNQTASINNAILSSDQTLSGSNLEQLGIGMAKYASSNFYTDGGAVNAYVLSPVGSFKTPDVYFEGMTIKFRAGFANSGASTVNVAGIGVVDLKKADGFTDLDPNEISNTIDSEFRYDGFAFARKALVQDASETKKGIVELLTNAETAAGADTTKAMTASNLASLFGTSLRSANGYVKLPVKVGGVFVEIIIQWGISGIIAGNGVIDITLPIANPGSTLIHLCSIQGSNSGISDPVMSQTLSLSQIRITNAFSSSVIANYLVIGY